MRAALSRSSCWKCSPIASHLLLAAVLMVASFAALLRFRVPAVSYENNKSWRYMLSQLQSDHLRFLDSPGGPEHPVSTQAVTYATSKGRSIQTGALTSAHLNLSWRRDSALYQAASNHSAETVLKASIFRPVAIYFSHVDRFARVAASGEVVADASFPWDSDSWFCPTPAFACAEAAEQASGQPPPQMGSNKSAGRVSEEVPPQTVGSAGWSVPASQIPAQCLRLRSLRTGRLLRMKGADGGEQAWVPMADGEFGAHEQSKETAHAVLQEPVQKRVLGPRRPGLRATQDEVWLLNDGGLQHVVTGGFLNARGHLLRGLADDGPPWNAATRVAKTTRLALRDVQLPQHDGANPCAVPTTATNTTATNTANTAAAAAAATATTTTTTTATTTATATATATAAATSSPPSSLTDDVENTLTTALLRRLEGAPSLGQPRSPRRAAHRTPHTFLSVDFHVATARDVGHTLKLFGQKLVDQSLSGACARSRTCADARQLRPLSPSNAFTLCPRPHALRRAVFDRLRNSPMIADADAIVCMHPAALCEVWLPFNKSLLLIVTANLELARENPTRWSDWLRTIVAMSKAPRVVIASNNRYDQAYVRHFTGVRPVYLPTLAHYVNARYSPQPEKPFLFARSHHPIGAELLRDVRRESPGLAVSSIEELYPGNAASGGYELSQLASHPAIVLVPYTKSTMTFFELYRMAIPIFVPSLKLLTQMELDRHVLTERVYWRSTPSPLHTPTTPDPNSLTQRDAVEYWLGLSDVYTFRHIQYFDSAKDLATKLRTTDVASVSQQMAAFLAKHDARTHAKWRAALNALFPPQDGSEAREGQTHKSIDFDAALASRFGLTLHRTEPDCSRHSAPDLGRWA